jgi:molybdenum cofactor cytidylyltransferase
VFVTGVVLAAGASRRLGTPKQLLPYRGATLLDSTLDTARTCSFDQLLITLGGSAGQVLERVDLAGATVVLNPDFGTGCGGSIGAALKRVDPHADGLILLLGDQVGVRTVDVEALLATVAAQSASIGVCRYRDGLGHPFWFRRAMFGELSQLGGDKAVWKLVHSDLFEVTECEIDAATPADVDTWADYAALAGK